MDEQLPSLSSDEGHVRITIPKTRLKDFIGDVLKTKRQIAKDFNAVFHVNKTDIINIISVINHRIEEQNSSDVSEITILVLYDDGSSREYTTIDQFETLDDNLKAVSTAVLISISYLIKFSRDDYPVKNDVKILLKSSEAQKNSLHTTGNVIITVDTNKFTWAEDIINNFSSYVDGRFQKQSRVSKFVEQVMQMTKSSLSMFLIPTVGFFAIFFSYIEELSRYQNSQLKNISKLLIGDDIAAANAKLDFLVTVRTLNFGLWDISIGFKYLVYLFTAILLLNILPNNYIRLTGKSYVSIGRVSEQKITLDLNAKASF